MYNILYLVNHNTYKIKMSRVRFHGIHALSKITNLTYSGIGWSNYDQKLTVQDNINNMKKHIINSSKESIFKDLHFSNATANQLNNFVINLNF